MNIQQLPSAKDPHGVFASINGHEMRYTDKTGLVHVAVGADVHPGVRLIWTLCERDVPAGEAWLLKPGDHHELCVTCAKRRNAPKDTQ